MLLTSVQEEGIPYNPFPSEESRSEYPKDELILNPNLGIIITGFADCYGFEVVSGIKLPKNRCTIILGITTEPLSVCKENYNEISQEDIYQCLEISIGGTTDEENPVKTLMYVENPIDFKTWTSFNKEIYVQIDFIDNKKEFVFYPYYTIGPIFAKYKLNNGNEITAYPKFYVRMSNEIHNHGPYNNGSNEPLIVTIDNSGYSS